MKKHFCLPLLAFWLSLSTAQAQFVKFEKEETFPADVQAVFGRATSRTAVGVATEFAGLWKTSLNDAQRKTVLRVAQDMQKRGIAPVPHLEGFLATINHLVRAKSRVAPDQLDKFINITEQTAKEMGPETLARFFSTTQSLLKSNSLYHSSFSRLRATKPVLLTFDYVPASKATEEVPVEKPDTLAAPAPDPAQDQKKPEPAQESWGADSGWGDPIKIAEDENKQESWGANDGWGDAGGGSSDFQPTEAQAAKGSKKTGQRLSQAPVQKIFPKPEVPVYPGPVINIAKTDLVMAGQHDSLRIAGAEGKIYVSAYQFVGKGGRADWSGLGLKPDETYADLDEYHFNIRVPELVAEHAKLYLKNRLDSGAVGVLEYRSLRAGGPDKAVYPRFQSYYNNLKVKNLAKDLEYEGGVGLVGKRFSSANFAQGPSTIVLSKNGQKKFKATSAREFMITDTTFRNPAVGITIYINKGQDSITHPGSQLNYNVAKGILNARKNRQDYSYTPYADSYHKVEVLADNLKWNVAQDSMEFSILSSNKAIQDSIMNTVKAEIRSVDYFSDPTYSSLQAGASFNPIGITVAYGKSVNSMQYASADLAKAFKINPNTVKSGMRFADRMGFISYDEANDWVTVKRKAILYFNASNRTIDFDNLEIYSATDFGRNAVLDLNTYELIVRGVRVFPLWRPATEDDQLGGDTPAARRQTEEDVARRNRNRGVWAYPEKNIIRIGKNRSISFNGRVDQRGYGKFWGKNFTFNYDTFKISMPEIDSIGILVRDSLTGRTLKRRDKKGNPTGEDSLMANKIRNANGVLYLAYPKNRSGEMRQYLPQAAQYPMFTAQGGAQITFSGNEILGGEKAYADSSIRFDMYAFKLDSMQSRPASANPLLGMFRTRGIFPDFEQGMKIQKDNSFGFSHDTKSDARFPRGYPLYTDSVGTMKAHTGVYNGTITLDNNGLRGSGTINYLSGTFESNDFIYYPDSVTSLSKHVSKTKDIIKNVGNIPAGNYRRASFPDVELLNYQMRWFPKADSMELTTTDTVNSPFKIYAKNEAKIARDQLSTYQGTLTYMPDSLTGRGIIENGAALAKSDFFNFQETKYTARYAKYFKLKTNNPETPAMLATNVAINYDMGERVANIRTEVEGEQSFRFPFTRYKTSLGEAVWNFDSKSVVMSLPEGKSREKAVFTSTKPEQKGLNFIGLSATYDMTKHILNIGGVPYIVVVDTKIFPKSGDVVIRGEANMDELKDSELFIAADNEYHKLKQGNIKITSRDWYEGSAVRPYVNDEGTEFAMKFDNFIFADMDVPDDTKESKGKVPAFKKERHTLARTEISEEDNFIKQAGIQYKGQVTMRAITPQLEFKGFYRYTDLEDGAWFAYNGLDSITYVDNTREVDGQKFGTGIFLGKNRDLYTIYESKLRDKNDEPMFAVAGQFKKLPTGYSVATADRRDKKTYRGNHFLYNNNGGNVEFDGKLDIVKPDPRFMVRTAGLGKGNFRDDKYNADMMIALQLEDGKGDAFKDLAKHLEEQADFEESVPKNDLGLFAKLGGIFPEAKTADDYARKAEDSELRDVMGNLALVISSAQMRWSADNRAWYSTGKIQVSNIFKQKVNMNMTGAIEIPVGKNADEAVINLYLKVNKRHWYFITYRKNDVKILTSSAELNTKVANPKSKDKFVAATSSEKNSFVSRFYRTYLDQEPPEDMAPADEDETIEKEGDDGK
jgi:hypothetical protein